MKIEFASSVRTHAPPRHQRAVGVGRIAVGVQGSQTRLVRLYQEGCCKIRLPRDHAARDLEAVLINSSGGVTGGDQLAWQADVDAGGALTLSTQACEKVYRSSEGAADITTSLTVGAGARLDWLPQETILFDGSSLRRRLEADLSPGATLLVAEAIILGRTARGERLSRGSLRDTWRIRRDGRLIFADNLALSAPIGDLADQAAVLDGARAFASLLFVSSTAQAMVEPLRQLIGDDGGVSAFEGKLFSRIVAADGQSLRRKLLPALAILRSDAPCPRVWRL